MPIVVKHAKTSTVPAWTQTELDAAIAGNPAPIPAGTLIDGFATTGDWNDDHIITGLDTEYARLDATNQPFTGGIDAPTVNGVALTTTGSATDFLNAEGDYVAAGGGGAPTGATYVTLTTNGSLTHERVLTAGTGISITDAGPGSTVTIAATADNVTIAGEDYLSLTGQLITANAIDLDNLSATGTPSASTFLRGDNTWAAPSGSGAVDSVNGATGVVVLDTDDIADTATNRYTTDTDITRLANTSGTNTGDNATNTQYAGLATSKQDTLVSGTNIKTINSTTLLGSGNIAVATSAQGALADTAVQPAALSSYATTAAVAAGYQPLATVLTNTTAAFTTAQETKLAGIAAGAEVNLIDSVTDTAEIDLTITGKALSAVIVAGSIDETKLDASVNASLDLADSAIQNLAGLGITASAAELNYVDGVTSAIQTQIDGKQATLVSATNIKTINGSSVLGSGDLAVGGASTALDNLAAVAINTSLLLGTSNSGALGSITKMWSDLFLASGGVINWNNGDVTLTHSSNLLTLGGGNFSVGTGDQAVISAGTVSLDISDESSYWNPSGLVFSIDVDPADYTGATFDIDGVATRDSAGATKTYLTNSYLNWSGTTGSTGYGIRDNAGVVEKKNSGGAWGQIWSGNAYTIKNASASLILDDDTYEQVVITPNSIQVANYDTLDGTSITPTRFMVGGSTILSDDYLNFSSTVGTSGYGIRNAAGVIQVKNSGGSWDKIETYDERLILGSDVTAAGTAYVDVTGMAFGYEANATYVFDMYLLVTSAAATNGHGFAWNTSTTINDVGLTFNHPINLTGGSNSGGGIGDDNATQATTTSSVPNTGTQYIQGSGILRSNVNSGLAQFRKRSEVAGNTVIKTGSVIVVRRIA